MKKNILLSICGSLFLITPIVITTANQFQTTTLPITLGYESNHDHNQWFGDDENKAGEVLFRVQNNYEQHTEHLQFVINYTTINQLAGASDIKDYATKLFTAFHQSKQYIAWTKSVDNIVLSTIMSLGLKNIEDIMKTNIVTNWNLNKIKQFSKDESFLISFNIEHNANHVPGSVTAEAKWEVLG